MWFYRQALQKDFHVSNERDGPRFWGIVGLARFDAMHRENAALQIYVRPMHLPRFGDSAAGIGEKPYEIGTVLRLPCAAGFNLFQQASELVWFRQMQFLGLNTKT